MLQILASDIIIDVIQWINVTEWGPLTLTCKRTKEATEQSGSVLYTRMTREITNNGGAVTKEIRASKRKEFCDKYKEEEGRIRDVASSLRKRDIVSARNLTHNDHVVSAGSLILGKPSTFDICVRVLFFFSLPLALDQHPDRLADRLTEPSLTQYVSPPEHTANEPKALTVIINWLRVVTKFSKSLISIDGGVNFSLYKKLGARYAPNSVV